MYVILFHLFRDVTGDGGQTGVGRGMGMRGRERLRDPVVHPADVPPSTARANRDFFFFFSAKKGPTLPRVTRSPRSCARFRSYRRTADGIFYPGEKKYRCARKTFTTEHL